MKHVAKTILKGTILIGGLVLSASIFAGCATDGLAGHPQAAPEGQLTSLENPEGIALPVIPVAERAEVDLVEELILHRAMYARYLRVLATYYSEQGYERKAKWARSELNDLLRVKPYRYIEDAETPVATLQPTESIAEADALYEEGLALMKKGGGNVPIFFNRETMTLALAKFKELVDKYPSSDKIDDAAFQIGEIHKEYGEDLGRRGP